MTQCVKIHAATLNSEFELNPYLIYWYGNRDILKIRSYQVLLQTGIYFYEYKDVHYRKTYWKTFCLLLVLVPISIDKDDVPPYKSHQVHSRH